MTTADVNNYTKFMYVLIVDKSSSRRHIVMVGGRIVFISRTL